MNQVIQHDTCGLDQLLKYFLMQCVIDSEDRSKIDQDTLLQQCLNKMLPICNEQEMQTLLHAYCAFTETDKPEHRALRLMEARQVSFIGICNYALRKLSILDYPPLRGPSPDDILFHWTRDILTLKSDREEQIPHRCFVIITSLASARRASNEHQNVSWTMAIENLCQHLPSYGFVWPDVLSAVDMAYYPTAIPRPPPQYSNTPHHDLSVSHPKKLAQWETNTQMTEESNTRIPFSKSDLQQSHTRCGICATNMLNSALSVNHVINMHIVDDMATIWWYDRQGIIRSEAMNFIQDLPRFLVLLLAFQRFTLEDWGINTVLNPNAHRFHDAATSDEVNVAIQASPFEFQFPASGSNEGTKVEINPKELLYGRWGLRGRATRVVGATSQSRQPVTGDSLDHIPLVVKLSWPETWRWSEQTVLARAKTYGKGNRYVENHLPDLLCSYDLGYSTGTIRKAVGVTKSLHSPKEPRVLRVTLFRRLYPLTMLCGEQFVAAWLGCIQCHYVLWTKGVRHNDPSLANLMLRRTNDKYYGVMNDWDLATLVGESPEKRGELTGTVLFMARDALFRLATKEGYQQIYRYDLEAFVWILFWVCIRYKDTHLIPRPPLGPLGDWNASSPSSIAREKQRLMDPRSLIGPHLRCTDSWKSEWILVAKLLDWMHESLLLRENDYVIREGYKEPADTTTYLAFMAVLTKVGHSHAQLRWLLDLVLLVQTGRLRHRGA